MKSIYILFGIAGMLTLTQNGICGGLTGTQIGQISVLSGNNLWFKTVGGTAIPTSPSPACAPLTAGQPIQFTIANETTIIGKQQFNMLLMAKTLGLKVDIVGANNCNRYGGTESIDRLTIY